mmetsp:Transcript_22107/g.69468  ORF Transcript_22107/g.69468 Transcript_22107/m.69468 type:complete len:243 (+) Transcript_22107:305-1033(+)
MTSCPLMLSLTQARLGPTARGCAPSPQPFATFEPHPLAPQPAARRSTPHGRTKMSWLALASTSSWFVVRQSSRSGGSWTAPGAMGNKLNVAVWEAPGGSVKWCSLNPQKRKASFSAIESRNECSCRVRLATCSRTLSGMPSVASIGRSMRTLKSGGWAAKSGSAHQSSEGRGDPGGGESNPLAAGKAAPPLPPLPPSAIPRVGGGAPIPGTGAVSTRLQVANTRPRLCMGAAAVGERQKRAE